MEKSKSGSTSAEDLDEDRMLLHPDPLIPFRLLRMSLASCKVFRPLLAASSARALAASARARSWSAVCKCMAGQRTNLPGSALPEDRQAPSSHNSETEARSIQRGHRLDTAHTWAVQIAASRNGASSKSNQPAVRLFPSLEGSLLHLPSPSCLP